MNEEKEKIAEIIGTVDLSNKSRVTKKEKTDYARLLSEVGDVKKKLDKLNLRLWHSVYKSDYHSLELSETEKLLRELAADIEQTADSISHSVL